MRANTDPVPGIDCDDGQDNLCNLLFIKKLFRFFKGFVCQTLLVNQSDLFRHFQ